MDINYNQAVFGLMLLGAKADGKLQDNEKRLLVDLTSEETPLSTEEYKDIIGYARDLDIRVFQSQIFEKLKQENQKNRIKAVYWLKRVLDTDTSSDVFSAQNQAENEFYQKVLFELDVTMEDVITYR